MNCRQVTRHLKRACTVECHMSMSPICILHLAQGQLLLAFVHKNIHCIFITCSYNYQDSAIKGRGLSHNKPWIKAMVCVCVCAWQWCVCDCPCMQLYSDEWAHKSLQCHNRTYITYMNIIYNTRKYKSSAAIVYIHICICWFVQNQMPTLHQYIGLATNNA